MKNKKKDVPKSNRAPYADLGLMVAVAIFIIMLIRILVFELTIFPVVLGCIALAYLFISMSNDSHKRIVHVSTTIFLVLTVLLTTGFFFFDQPVRPKMVAFQGAAADTIKEEEALEVAQPVDIPKDTVVEVDSAEQVSSADTVVLQENVQTHPTDTTGHTPAAF